MPLHKKISSYKVYAAENERDTSSLDCKHKHVLWKTELHLTYLVSYTILHIGFHSFNSRIDASGLSTLVPGINWIFLETVSVLSIILYGLYKKHTTSLV